MKRSKKSICIGLVILILACVAGVKGIVFLREKEFRENLLTEIDSVVQEVSASHGLFNVVTQDYEIVSMEYYHVKKRVKEDGLIDCKLYLETPEFQNLSYAELANYSDELEEALEEKGLLSPENIPLDFGFQDEAFQGIYMCPVYNVNGCMTYTHCSANEISYGPLFADVGEKKVYDLDGNKRPGLQEFLENEGSNFASAGLDIARNKDSYGHDKFDAMVIAEKVVKDNLKSPSTAEFCKSSEYTVSCVGNTWTVKGYVDAQNSFGATLRNNFTVKFTFSSSNEYTVDSCSIT